ncbi:unnamed protein product, partial [Urochloa humidicola]
RVPSPLLPFASPASPSFLPPREGADPAKSNPSHGPSLPLSFRRWQAARGGGAQQGYLDSGAAVVGPWHDHGSTRGDAGRAHQAAGMWISGGDLQEAAPASHHPRLVTLRGGAQAPAAER